MSAKRFRGKSPREIVQALIKENKEKLKFQPTTKKKEKIEVENPFK